MSDDALTPQQTTEFFCTAAKDVGFQRVAFAAVGPVERHAIYQRWIDDGYAGGMTYLAADSQPRRDPRALLSSARTVVSVALSYAHADPIDVPADALVPGARGRIARYARSADYHMVMKHALNALARAVTEQLARPVAWLSCVDSQPILEREWAHQAGLGFLGKNTLAITPGLGSWVLLGELLTDLECTPGEPSAPKCGQCRSCLDRCPTGAFVDAYTLDARRCISYLTIENAGEIPYDLRALVGDWIFGCDVCQDVCPFNHGGAALAGSPLLAPRPGYGRPLLRRLLGLGAAQFRKWNKQTAMRRVHRAQLLRNVAVALGNVGTGDDVPALIAALAESSPLVRAHVVWALGELALRLGVDDARAALLAHDKTEIDEGVKRELRLAIARCA